MPKAQTTRAKVATKTKKSVAKATTKKKAAKSKSAVTKKASTKAKTPKPSAKTKAKAPASSASTSYQLKVGDRAPAFSAASTSGGDLSLGDFAGRTLVLYFYPKDNTPGCTLEGQDFRRLYSRFQAIGCDVVGVSRDSLKSHESFKEKCDFPFALLSDPEGKLCSAFDVIQMKSLYGRKFEGIERSTFVIDSKGVVRGEWRKVKVNGHAEAVLDFVKGL